jgi:hypothetical protein
MSDFSILATNRLLSKRAVRPGDGAPPPDLSLGVPFVDFSLLTVNRVLTKKATVASGSSTGNARNADSSPSGRRRDTGPRDSRPKRRHDDEEVPEHESESDDMPFRRPTKRRRTLTRKAPPSVSEEVAPRQGVGRASAHETTSAERRWPKPCHPCTKMGLGCVEQILRREIRADTHKRGTGVTCQSCRKRKVKCVGEFLSQIYKA